LLGRCRGLREKGNSQQQAWSDSKDIFHKSDKDFQRENLITDFTDSANGGQGRGTTEGG
jgi:hypothetical protein